MSTLPAGVKLNIGCGKFPCKKPDWLNVDASPEVGQFVASLGGDYVFLQGHAHDLHFIDDERVAMVYASHLLEHYPPARCQAFYRPNVVDLLREWHRILKPGGELWVAVPDLIACCNRILSEPNSRDEWVAMLFAHHAHERDEHHWAYSEISLRCLLMDNGFMADGDRFQPFAVNPVGDGTDCAGAWCPDDRGYRCVASLNLRARKL